MVYRAEHVRESDDLLLVTNDDAVEFRLARAPVPRDADQDHTAWTEVVPERPAERLERVDAFAGHAVLSPAHRAPSTCCAWCRSPTSPDRA